VTAAAPPPVPEVSDAAVAVPASTPVQTPTREPALAQDPVILIDPAPAPAPPNRSGPADGPADDLEQLRRGWATVVSAIAARSPAAKAAIVDCRPIGLEGRVVTIGFPEEKSFLKDATERRRPLLEACIGEFLGHEVGVRLVATNLELVPPLPDDGEAAAILARAHEIFADARLDVPEVS
jgi:hypothetical protein